jgi:hypothetical protein
VLQQQTQKARPTIGLRLADVNFRRIDLSQKPAQGSQLGSLYSNRETAMLTAIVLGGTVLVALCLAYLAYEQVQTQKAYRRARVSSRIR